MRYGVGIRDRCRVLSQHADEGYVLELLRDGTDGYGYLLKERVGDRSELLRALSETSRGGSVIDPVLIDGLVGRRRAEAHSPLADLTARELDVLRLMAEGRSNSGIAEELSLSESSIEKHISERVPRFWDGLHGLDGRARRCGASLAARSPGLPGPAGCRGPALRQDDGGGRLPGPVP